MTVEQSKSISILSLYLILPCVVISAFQIESSPAVRDGLILATVSAVVIHAVMILVSIPFGKMLTLSALEKLALIYSNAGGLIFPLITATLGSEYIIYSCPYVCVQMLLLWSHGKSVLCGEKTFDFHKIITNINLISVFIGLAMFALGIHFPPLVQDAVSSVSDMVGPVGMLVTGMLLGGMDLRKSLSYRRLLLVIPLRLIIMPLIAMAALHLTGIFRLAGDSRNILLISLMAAMAPSATTVTQMAQVYNKDADYASAINVTTTLLCIITMPILVGLSQL